MKYPLEQLPSLSLGDRISTKLRFDIISGEIKPGTVISENSVAAQFEASRSPAREALKILANEGLVRLERTGAVVVGLSKKDVAELYDVRFLIESFSMKECAKNADPELFAKLSFTIEKMKIAAAKGDFMGLSMQDIEFHEAIIEAAQHTRILHMWMGIRNIVITALLIATEKRFAIEQHEIDQLIEKHVEIVNRIKEGDPQAIEDMLSVHFTDTRKTVGAIIQTNE